MAEGHKKPIVIFGIDSSEHSLHAFNFYNENLHKPGNELLLLHCGELPHMTTSYSMYATGTMWEELLQKEKKAVKELEDKYAELMKQNGLTGKIKGIFGNRPGEFIVHEANEVKSTMIIMGTRGLGSVRRTILGSVSDYVVHHAHCPVIVCRQ